MYFWKIMWCIFLSVWLPFAKANNLSLSDWQYVSQNIESISNSSKSIPVSLSAEVISQLLDSLDQHLHGKQILFTCTADNSKIEPVAGSARADDPEDILDRLADRSFQDLFIHVEAEALSRVLLNETTTQDEKQFACDRIDYYHKLSVCLTTGGTCPARPALGDKKIVVIQETARLRQELVEYLLFILFAYRTDTAYWREAASSSDLKPAFSRLLQSAIQFYLQWHRAQIVFASVESLPDFAIEELVRHGAPVEEIRKLHKQLGKSTIDLERISRETIESVGTQQLVAELEANLQEIIAHVRATERALDKYKKEIDARIALLSGGWTPIKTTKSFVPVSYVAHA